MAYYQNSISNINFYSEYNIYKKAYNKLILLKEILN